MARRYSAHVMLPNRLLAAVNIEADRTGESVSAVIRRCIRQGLAEAISTAPYKNELARLERMNGEEEE